LNNLQGNADLKAKLAVTKETSFVGFDAYKQVIDSGVDVVLLCTPPHFRPLQLEYAIAKGKHVFCEKPVAVDAPGIHRVLATVEEAKKKNLSLVSGLCWRYDLGVRETMKRVLDGEIGDLIAIQENYLTNGLWHRGHKPEWSEMEYQIRNWLYFTWLSGDHNVEQHIHSLDKASWAMHDEPPIRATGLGGRQVRTEPMYGQIFDHHAVVYEYANGVKVFAYTRQQDNCANDVEDYFLGTKGRAKILKHEIANAKGEVQWKYKGPKPNMYQVEHNELFASIRSGQPINNGHYMAQSTMLAIFGRMVDYTGQTLSWDQGLNSREDLTPAQYAWGDIATPAVARPGVTKFV
jgi:predicted dehydrogenase